MRTYEEQTALILMKVNQYGSAKKKKNIIYFVCTVTVCFLLMFTLSIPGVRAAMQQLFTIIPGMGIVKTSEQPVYIMMPICERVKADDAVLSLYGVVFSEERLSIYIYAEGKDHFHVADPDYLNKTYDPYDYYDPYDDFTFYINDGQVDEKNVGRIDNTYTSQKATILNFYFEVPAPESEDIYKISIDGFSDQLSFKLTPCLRYDDIAQIGPTDTQNGISVTAITTKLDDNILVWCYPFREDDAVEDKITGYGNWVSAPIYIKSDNGFIYRETSKRDLHIYGRYVFDMPEVNQNVSLHIPCLSMLHNEKINFSVNLPKDYSTDTSNQTVECSLGTIKVVEIERSKYDKYGVRESVAGKDIITLKFAYESNNINMQLYDASLLYDGSALYDYKDSMIVGNSETGGMEYCLVSIDEGIFEITLEIQAISYNLFGEYVIPLNIEE